MKKILAGVVTACLLLGIAGCGTNPEAGTEPTSKQAPQTTEIGNTPTTEPVLEESSASSMTALAMPTALEEIYSEDGTLLFTLSIPRFQPMLGDPYLEETITGALQDRLSGILSEAEEVHAMAEEAYQESEPDYWHPYSCSIAYTPTRLDDSILSLFGNRSRYSGGAHSTDISDSVTFELSTGKELALADILTTPVNYETLCSMVLVTLAKQADALYYNYEETVRQRFSGDPSELPKWYFSRTGLCFHFFPYDIAPYSSGTIIAELPYEDLKDMLQERFFPTSQEEANGSMYAQLSGDDKVFENTIDVVLSEEAAPICLYTDARVANVRIETCVPFSDETGFISTGVVFMANTLDIGDGILLYADLTQPDQLLRLVYRSGAHEVSSLITVDAAGNVVLAGS